MKWDFAEDEALRIMLNKVIQLVGVNITIVGNWIWIDGDTKPLKATFKELGFKWAHEKKMWYWHSEAFRKKSNKKLSFDTICNYKRLRVFNLSPISVLLYAYLTHLAPK